MSGKIYLDGQEVDGSWVLRIYITDLKIERCLRVKGDLHIGGVMLRLVEDLNIALDWSDHALWWPSRNFWLTRTRSTLDQYGVTADAILHFTPMHKALRIQLPDMRYIDCKIDFSVKTFNAVINICKELCIRYPEELSFCKPLEPHDLKQNLKDNPTKKKLDTESYKNGANALSDTNTFVMRTQNNYGSIDSLDQHEPYLCAPIGAHSKSNRTHIDSSEKNPENWRRNNNTLDISNKGCFNHNSSSTGLELFNAGLLELLSQTPSSLSSDENLKILRPRTLLERARINVSWLDSSLSIMEQGVCEYDTLKLRYKFYSFYDLNPKLDQVRINMIYEQAKWQLLSEEIDCTEEEMFVFAGLQMQVNFQASTWKPGRENNDLNKLSIDDDIDAALTDLQITLEGSAAENINSNITQIPELSDYLRLFKPKRFTLKAFKRYWIVCKDLHLKIYKNREDCEIPVFAINLHGCEITPDIHIAQNRYGIRLEVPSAEGMTEIWIRCDTEKQYANWLAACRLAAKGRSLADASYSNEVKRIEDFLQLQKPSTEPTISPTSLGDVNPEDYVASRFLKKLKVKLIQRILEAQANVKNLTLIEAKLEYIKAWQSLPEYGISLFAVRFAGKNKDELLGIAFNRLLRMDINTGNHLKTWRFNTMKAWNINWEVKHMMVQFEEENIIFECRTADCKVVHEFIGGYIFLSMRSKEANQSLNEEMFHKLTGGWH